MGWYRYRRINAATSVLPCRRGGTFAGGTDQWPETLFNSISYQFMLKSRYSRHRLLNLTGHAVRRNAAPHDGDYDNKRSATI